MIDQIVKCLKFTLSFPILLVILTGCETRNHDAIDSLNKKAYSLHYKNIDSAFYYANKAIIQAKHSGYDSGVGEALNNLAFVGITKMEYDHAEKLLDSVSVATSNQVELFIADVQLMRICQRQSRNKEFYDHREKALRRIHRISEEQQYLNNHLKERYVYGLSEFGIITSAYYYYVGLSDESRSALEGISLDEDLRKDTAQLLAYYYNVGAGGMITKGGHAEISQKEFDYLIRCYMISHNHGYVFWEANALQAMSEHLLNEDDSERLIADNTPALRIINIDKVADSLLAGNMAERSLSLFENYGDEYQIAGALRTLAQCYWNIGEYQQAIQYLEYSFDRSNTISNAPYLIVSICEQLCLAYSAIDNKQSSDHYRNLYLDLQEETRQDRYLESRADQLKRSISQLNTMIIAVVLMIAVIVALMIFFAWIRRRDKSSDTLKTLAMPLEEWQKLNGIHDSELMEQYETIKESLSLAKLNLAYFKKINVEQRAKVSLINSITPLIERMLHEINRLRTHVESQDVRDQRVSYVKELIDQIDEYNQILTQWIQLRKGELSIKVESIRLQRLFDIVEQAKGSFSLKGISFKVEPTEAVVKCDPTLTLFMINTITDNARKFTSEGGSVTVSAQENDSYVEISVTDNGCGMGEEQLEHLFDKPILHPSNNGIQHGFGLMNCKGIIEKYKKTSRLFSVCMIAADSKVGKGSRLFFRLPKGIVRMLVALAFMSMHPIFINASNEMKKAQVYADSVFQCNINGRYLKTLAFADSTMNYLNAHCHRFYPKEKTMMKLMGSTSETPAETQWYLKGVKSDYDIALSIRNECAVAALALHEWQLYQYNNYAYTKLYHEMSADSSLSNYCRTMQKAETNKYIAIALLILLLISIFPLYYFFYYRHRMYYRSCIERIKSINNFLLDDTSNEAKLRNIRALANGQLPDNLQSLVENIINELKTSEKHTKLNKEKMELLKDEYKKTTMEGDHLHVTNSILDNCLSTLKHETMYYPSRIKHLLSSGTMPLDTLEELAKYYKDLHMLLSRQAARQINLNKFTAKHIKIEEVLPHNVILNEEQKSVFLKGDNDLLRSLFEILHKATGYKGTDISICSNKNNYITINMALVNMKMTDEECRNMFFPNINNIPYLICRQIIRDIGEITNKRGCGIEAEHNENNGVTIKVTLPGSKI